MFFKCVWGYDVRGTDTKNNGNDGVSWQTYPCKNLLSDQGGLTHGWGDDEPGRKLDRSTCWSKMRCGFMPFIKVSFRTLGDLNV